MAKDDVIQDIAALRKLTTAELRKRYQDVMGEPARSNNKPYLFKRIAYRLQEKKHGGLSPRARDRAAELAQDAPIKRRPNLKDGAAPDAIRKKIRDPRLPAPGTVLKRTYGKKEYAVTVEADAFTYKGQRYTSLSAIASEIAGARWNGFSFFGILGKGRAS